MRRTPTIDLERTLLAELDVVYCDAAVLHAGWSCPASTECCRFGITGREPYVTSIELTALRRAIAARGGTRSWRRAVPMTEGGEGEQRCALLTEDGKCAVYKARPLGCRTFYCARAEAGGRVKHAEVNALVRRIQAIAVKHEPGGDLGRPLSRALG